MKKTEKIRAWIRGDTELLLRKPAKGTYYEVEIEFIPLYEKKRKK
jgi:hypothetical protein